MDKIISVKWSDYCNLGMNEARDFRDKVEHAIVSVIVSFADNKIYFHVKSYNVKHFIGIASVDYNMETTVYKKRDDLEGEKESQLYRINDKIE